MTDVYPRVFTWHKFYTTYQQNPSMACTYSFKHRKSAENE